MTIENAFQHFVEPMQRVFPVSRDVPRDSFLEEVAAALATFSIHQLTSATEWFKRNRDQRFFPLLSECRKACEQYAENTAPLRSVKRFQTEDEQASERRLDHERRINAYRLCRCSMGRQADHQGWLVSLIEFCEDNQRLPQTDREIHGVRMKAQRSEEALERARGGDDGEPSPFYPKLMEWRQAMLDRAHKEVFEYGTARQTMAAE